ncbi:MAG TPA: hypothetical protein VMG08_04775 [Allosphingosinicella sp.]|nr:hypothetical protein [Allosphingosinicella sp.]
MNAGIILSVLATLAAPAAATPGSIYQVRNASRTPLMCGLPVSRGGAFYRFTLRPGQAFRQRIEGDRALRLTCSSSIYRRTVFRIRAGLAYELRETGRGALLLRNAGPQGSERHQRGE